MRALAAGVVGLALAAITLVAPTAAVPAAVGSEATCDGRVATIVGTSDDDVLTGTPGPDVIAGLEGDDRINGGDGDDTICGDDGADVVAGGPGDDRLFGGLDGLET